MPLAVVNCLNYLGTSWLTRRPRPKLAPVGQGRAGNVFTGSKSLEFAFQSSQSFFFKSRQWNIMWGNMNKLVFITVNNMQLYGNFTYAIPTAIHNIILHIV